MAKTATVHELVFEAVAKKALGNSKTSLKNVASDYINQYHRREFSNIADGCFLSTPTIARVADCEDEYTPQLQTIERILIYFGAEIDINEVTIKKKFQNQPKPE